MPELIPVQPVSYKQFMVIIAAQFVVLFPHLSHLPPLFSALAFLTLLGLILMAKARKTLSFNPQPSRIFQYTVVLLGLGIIFFTYRTIIGIDAGVYFLILCLLGKSLELKQRRDAYIVLMLALFVVASLFLFGQSILNAVMALAGILAVFYALLQQNINSDVLTHHSSQLHIDESAAINPHKGLWKPLLKLF